MPSAKGSLIELWDALCPLVHGNPYIPHRPTRKQAEFLRAHLSHKGKDTFHCLYGGAAGGGKSDALLMAAAQFCWKKEHGNFAAILFRRTHTELAEPDALMARAMQWWIPRKVHWNGVDKIFTFPSGAKVSFAYLKNPTDHLRYQGAAFQLVGFDELTQWPDPIQPDYVGFSRTRRPEGSTIPLRYLACSNPGGPGHAWCRKRFIGAVDHEGRVIETAQYEYIPATIQDNPHLDRESYVRTLEHLHPTTRAQLLAGDWSARDPGDFFRSLWFGPLLDPETDTWASSDCIRIRWWDLAASEKEDAAFTAGVRMARHRSGVRAIEHCRAFRATPGRRDSIILQTAKADGYGVVVGIEIEGGSGGPAQFESLQRLLKSHGFRVSGAKPKVELTDREGKLLIRNPTALTGKEGRAAPVASCLERGYQRRGEGEDNGSPWFGADAGLPVQQQRDGLRLFAGPWTQAYLDVVEGFPDGATCDEVDATSGAWAWLEAHPVGQQRPAFTAEEPAPRKTSDAWYPDDDEDEPTRKGRGRAARWTP